MMKIKAKSIVMSVMLLLITSLTYSQDPNFHIYLCFGQSNMEGQGSTSGIPAADSRFQQMQTTTCDGRTQGQWYTANPPLARCGTGLGPADYFGRTMVEKAPSNVKIGVIVVAVAGCKIELFGTGYQSYLSSAESYIQNISNQYGGNPYGRLIELAKSAQSDGVIKGILLHQGESNTGDSDWPNKVNAIYKRMLSDLSLNASDVPILIGQMLPEGSCAGFNSTIGSTPNTIPTAHVVNAPTGTGSMPDGLNVHFTEEGYKQLGINYANEMLKLVTFETGVPTVKFTSPTASDAFEAPASITLTVDATDEDGSISKVEFFNGDQKLGEASGAPYTYEWTDVSEGSYEISAVATDNDQKTSSASITIKVNVPQGPYNGTAHIIPGKIEFEEFDVGGNGSAYNDATPGTEVNPAPDFRTDEDVDIETCTDDGGGYNLGWTAVGEWTEYTVDVKNAGTYTMGLRVAGTGTGKTISVESNGTSIANDISIPNTGDWQTWETVSEEVELEAGEQVLRFTIGGDDYINMNYVEFAFTGDPCADNPYPDVCSCDDLAIDSDNDGTPDCADLCPNDSNKTEPGECDCGTPEGECGTAESNMRKGWNLIGYPYDGEVALETALQSIWDKVEVVKNMDAFYSKDANPDLNLLKTVKFGYGYFVRVSEPCYFEWGK